MNKLIGGFLVLMVLGGIGTMMGANDTPTSSTTDTSVSTPDVSYAHPCSEVQASANTILSEALSEYNRTGHIFNTEDVRNVASMVSLRSECFTPDQISAAQSLARDLP